MLEVHDLHATHGVVRAVRAASFQLAAGEVLAVLGPNGAGKSTLANALAGVHAARTGRVVLAGTDLGRAKTTVIARAGIALVPQGRRVFGSCTVAEHVRLAAAHARPGATTAREMLDLFPRLRDRWSVRARHLSGGEQQMLAITRAVVMGPRVLILDEPTEGLAPAVVSSVAGLIQLLSARGVGVLVMEQSRPFADLVADRVAAMDRGVLATGPAPVPALTGEEEVS